MLYFLDVLKLTIIGFVTGLFTGLIPAFHPNNVIQILEYYNFNIEAIPFFIIAMCITHSIVSFIPSILIGIPEEITALSLPPSQKLILKGRMFEAIILSTLGGFIGSIFSIILVLLFNKYLFIRDILNSKNIVLYFFYIIITISLVYKEKNKIFAILIIVLSLLVWNIIKVSYLPTYITLGILFMGIFGTSSAILPIFIKSKKIKQKIENIKINAKELFVYSLLGSILASIQTNLPLLTTTQALILSSFFIKIDDKKFLITAGSITTSLYILALGGLYYKEIGKTGAIIYIKNILNNITSFEFYLLLLFTLFIVSISSILTIYLSKILIKAYNKISNFSNLLINYIAIFVSIIISWYFARIEGILILILATLLGIFCQIKKVSKSITICGLFYI